jgi:hypothetical protein
VILLFIHTDASVFCSVAVVVHREWPLTRLCQQSPRRSLDDPSVTQERAVRDGGEAVCSVVEFGAEVE